jgi:hypothetical protein
MSVETSIGYLADQDLRFHLLTEFQTRDVNVRLDRPLEIDQTVRMYLAMFAARLSGQGIWVVQ